MSIPIKPNKNGECAIFNHTVFWLNQSAVIFSEAMEVKTQLAFLLI